MNNLHTIQFVPVWKALSEPRELLAILNFCNLDTGVQFRWNPGVTSEPEDEDDYPQESYNWELIYPPERDQVSTGWSPFRELDIITWYPREHETPLDEALFERTRLQTL